MHIDYRCSTTPRLLQQPGNICQGSQTDMSFPTAKILRLSGFRYGSLQAISIQRAVGSTERGACCFHMLCSWSFTACNL